MVTATNGRGNSWPSVEVNRGEHDRHSDAGPLLMVLSDRRRIVVMLRVHGCPIEEIAAFTGITIRLVRSELGQATKEFPGLLDFQCADNRNRSMRMAHLLGASDAGAAPDQLVDLLDSLVERANWLRAREALTPLLGRPMVS